MKVRLTEGVANPNYTGETSPTSKHLQLLERSLRLLLDSHLHGWFLMDVKCSADSIIPRLQWSIHRGLPKTRQSINPRWMAYPQRTPYSTALKDNRHSGHSRLVFKAHRTLLVAGLLRHTPEALFGRTLLLSPRQYVSCLPYYS